jgi:capsular exopolysaccharide synthesis family protein
MSRLGQALKKRDKEGKRGDGVDSTDIVWRRRHDIETPVVPAWQLERFPNEAPGTREADTLADVVETVDLSAVQAPPLKVEQPPISTPILRQKFSRIVAGKAVGDRGMDRGAVEQYRRLAASLHHVQVERGTRKVIVTSAVSREGKTLTSLNLALTLSASYRRRVVLIDANLRSPCVHKLLGMPSAIGLNEALSDPRQATPALLEISPRLSVLPAGHADPDPMGPLTSPRMALILDEMAANFDWVIVDTPPVVLLPDTNLLVGMVDAAIVVIEAGRTPYELIDRTVKAIGRQRVLGFVLNGVEREVSSADRVVT